MAERYITEGWEVHGTVRQGSSLQNIADLPALTLHQMDLTDSHAVGRAVSQGFDVIHILGAVTLVPYSWSNPITTMDTNVNGPLNVLEAVRRLSVKPLLHYPSTCEVYGIVDRTEVPIGETAPVRPSSPYAASKACAEMLCSLYWRAWGVKVIITRAFNHESRRRPYSFLTRTVCRQAAEIALGKREEFKLGNLEAVRDWTDARDMAEAYMMAIQVCPPGEPFNICSEKGLSIRQIVEIVAGHAGLSEYRIKQDPSKLRPVDNPVFVGNCSKFREATGWIPKRDIRDTLREMYEAELGELAR